MGQETLVPSKGVAGVTQQLQLHPNNCTARSIVDQRQTAELFLVEVAGC